MHLFESLYKGAGFLEGMESWFGQGAGGGVAYYNHGVQVHVRHIAYFCNTVVRISKRLDLVSIIE